MQLLSKMAAPHGFEPRLTQSECAVLPLDDGAIILGQGLFYVILRPLSIKKYIIFTTKYATV